MYEDATLDMAAVNAQEGVQATLYSNPKKNTWCDKGTGIVLELFVCNDI